MTVKIKKKELILVLITILIVLIAVILFNDFKKQPAEKLTIVENEVEEFEANINLDEQTAAEEDSTKIIASIDELQDPFFNDQVESDNHEKAAVKEEELLNFAESDNFWQEEKVNYHTFYEQNEANDLINNKKELITIPFKLQGIIKDKNYSLALFEYQNQLVEKREGEKLAGFLIKNIDAKEVLITLEHFTAKLSVWGDNKLE